MANFWVRVGRRSQRLRLQFRDRCEVRSQTDTIKFQAEVTTTGQGVSGMSPSLVLTFLLSIGLLSFSAAHLSAQPPSEQFVQAGGVGVTGRVGVLGGLSAEAPSSVRQVDEARDIGPVGGIQGSRALAAAEAGGAALRRPARYARINYEASPTPAQGQVWREYDLRPYLERVRGMESPHQPVIDWILRETGTQRWFGELPGMISFEVDRLRVYHVPEVHEQVAEIVERYVSPELASTAVSVRLVTVDSVNWRALAAPLMTPVRVQTPGVDAWLLTRENAALLMAHLRQRVDYREHNSSQTQIGHGQMHLLERWQPRTYRQSVSSGPAQLGTGGYQIQLGELREGYRLQLSPLATEDRQMMDVTIKCAVDQIEKMSSVSIDVPGVKRRVEIDVPQVSSWSLQERFRWPTTHVLLISRGMVAMPGLKRDDNGPLPNLIANRPARADALLFLESRQPRGRSTVGTASRALVPHATRLNYHNRY